MTAWSGDTQEHRAARARMVEALRRAAIVDERVLTAMGRVPRHLFLPAEVQNEGYEPRPVPLPGAQTMSAPYIVAHMSELLELKGGERVLEIGTGCGYQTAVLCELGCRVCSVEIVPELAAFAAENLRALGYVAQLREGDGALGWHEGDVFDCCLVAATAPHLPRTLVRQLAVGGRLVVPLAVPSSAMESEGGRVREVLTRSRKTATGLQTESLYPVRFVPMTGAVQVVQAMQGIAGADEGIGKPDR